MASIFHQLGGQGPMPGLVPGDAGDDAGKARCCMYCARAGMLISYETSWSMAGEDGQHRRAQEAQFIAQQVPHITTSAVASHAVQTRTSGCQSTHNQSTNNTPPPPCISGHHNVAHRSCANEEKERNAEYMVITGYTQQQSRSLCISARSDTLSCVLCR